MEVKQSLMNVKHDKYTSKNSCTFLLRVLSSAMAFSNEEKLDMLEIFYRSNKSGDLASQRYLEAFPERPQPHRTFFFEVA